METLMHLFKLHVNRPVARVYLEEHVLAWNLSVGEYQG